MKTRYYYTLDKWSVVESDNEAFIKYAEDNYYALKREHWRELKRCEVSLDAMEERERDSALADYGADPLEILIRQEESRQDVFEQYFTCLTDRQREAVLLYYREGLPYVTVANEMGISKQAAIKLVKKSLEKIRRGYQKPGANSLYSDGTRKDGSVEK